MATRQAFTAFSICAIFVRSSSWGLRQTMTQRILIISDYDPGESLRRVFDGKRFSFEVAVGADEGYRQLLDRQFDLVIVSVENAATGTGLIRRIRASENRKQLRVVTIARWGTGQATLALSQGADAFERKPIEADRLLAAIENLLRPAMVMTAKAGAAGASFEES